MSWKNALIRAVVRGTGAKKGPAERPARILVVATTALGDTLWATPALRSLRDSFREAYVAVLTSPIGLQVLKGNPAVDRLYLWGRPWALWRQLRRERFDTALIFHASQRLPLPLVALSGVTRIVGTKGLNKGLDDLLTVALPDEHQHEIARRLKMVEAIGGRVSEEKLSFYLEAEEEMPWEEGMWVGVHPGAKDGFKLWPAGYFAEVARALQERLGAKILVTGTADERPLMEEVARRVPGSRLLEKGLSLRGFAAVLKKMDLFICNDTGPFHLACALERPVIGVYSATDPALCGPYKADCAHVVARPPTCRPCLRKKCRSPFCLLQIAPEEVINVALKVLSNTPVG